MGYGFTVRIRGARACFTRPEMHVERVSYDVVTPSAARGIMEAVYWKPAIVWRVDRITVQNPIEFASIRRNELNSKLSYDGSGGARALWRTGEGEISVNAAEDRAQRNTLYLVDVDYLVDYHFELTSRAGDEDTVEKHYNIALRRLRKGQFFNHPYLGCREFPAEVTLVEEGEARPESFYGAAGERDLGFMLYDLDFEAGKAPRPHFFRAVMRDGVIDAAAARGRLLS